MTGTLPTAVAKFGAGFSVTRLTLVGGYRITIPPGPKFLATVATPSTVNTIAYVVRHTRKVDGSTMIDVEIRDRTTGALVDGDFNFLA